MLAAEATDLSVPSGHEVVGDRMDEDISKLLNEHDYDAAFGLIVERFKVRVFRLAYSFVRSEVAAEDLAQDTFIKIWKALPGFSGTAALSTWIYAITRNTCLTALKRIRPTLSLSDPDTRQALEGLPELQQESAANAAQLDVDVLLAGLPEKYLRVITLFYLEQQSYEDVAELMGIPIGTVKTFLHRARRDLVARAGRLLAAESLENRKE